MKSITDKRILIIFSLFLGCLIISPLFDTYAADLEKRVQTVDPVLEAKFLLMERGKIPIGECVDEAEDLAQKIIDGMDTLNENIEEEMSAGNGLIWMPEDCKCGNCSNHCDCEYDDEGKCTSCHCTSCEGDVCPFDEIKKQVDAIQDADDKIIKSTQRLKDLIEAKNLEQYDPDRWEILNKLLNSRYKMEECVQGFESALKHPRTEINFLSCRMAMDEIELGSLVLLEYFESHISDYPYCYPYTANSAIREICKNNRDSDNCHIPLKGCMDNYFCAGFVGPTGDLGGNKEGDEPQVEEGVMPHCSSLYTPGDDVPADDGSDDDGSDDDDVPANDGSADDTLPDGVPQDSLCVQRVLKMLKDGTEFDVVRATTNRLFTDEEFRDFQKYTWEQAYLKDFMSFDDFLKNRHPANNIKYGFNCIDTCSSRGQDCVGIGLYNVEKTYCRYIVHNIGYDCQLSENLNWGECDMPFLAGTGFCGESKFPPDFEAVAGMNFSWGNLDTGCYCVDKGYLPDEEE